MPIFSNYKCFQKCATLCFQKCVTFVSIEKYKSNDRMNKKIETLMLYCGMKI